MSGSSSFPDDAQDEGNAEEQQERKEQYLRDAADAPAIPLNRRTSAINVTPNKATA
jgi:hypothetical protein